MPEYTVLTHIRLAGITGGAQKSPDQIAAHGCDRCHAIVDGHVPLPEGYTQDMVDLAHAHGVFRTQYKLIKRGIIK